MDALISSYFQEPRKRVCVGWFREVAKRSGFLPEMTGLAGPDDPSVLAFSGLEGIGWGLNPVSLIQFNKT